MTTDRLFQMARMASKNTNLIAFLIERYTASESEDWSYIAKKHDMTMEQLTRLALCRRPRSAYRVEDMREISDHVGVEMNALATFVTDMENMVELRSTGDDQFLMAARDRNEDEDSQ